jgi:hypothetical protein
VRGPVEVASEARRDASALARAREGLQISGLYMATCKIQEF